MNNIKKPKNFEDNYKILQDIAAKLRNNQNINVDQLLPLIKEATSAYEKCKSKLKTIHDALQEHFKDLV